MNIRYFNMEDSYFPSELETKSKTINSTNSTNFTSYIFLILSLGAIVLRKKRELKK